jgi:glycosyltransferase involved in cell wall biosynthesis
MQILFFSSYYYPYISGITTYPHQLLQRLSGDNQITVLTFPHSKGLLHREKITNINIIRIPYQIKISKGYISPQSFSTFYHYAKDSELIILNIPNAEGLLLAIIARLLGKKVISLYHCRVYLYGGLYSRIINTILDISVSLQLFLSHKIITHTKDYATNQSQLKPFLKKTSYIFPYINKPTIDKKQRQEFIKQKKNKYWIGFVGRISSEKGLEYLIDAIKLIPNNQKYELVIAGPMEEVVGERKYYQFIQQKLQSSGINNQIFGPLEQKHLGAFYKSLDVLVLPSTNKTEAFGMVQVEAMLVSTPVIASDLPGVRVPLKISHIGLLSPPKDSRSLAKNIQYIINNKKKIVNQATDIQEHFSSDRIVKKWVTLILQLSQDQ